MSVMNRFIYGVIVEEAPNMKQLYDEIAEEAGKLEGFDWQSDVMYGDEPELIIVGVNSSATFENFEQVSIGILTERVEAAERVFNQHSDKLIEFLKSKGAEVSPPGTYNFSYQD